MKTKPHKKKDKSNTSKTSNKTQVSQKPQQKITQIPKKYQQTNQLSQKPQTQLKYLKNHIKRSSNIEVHRLQFFGLIQISVFFVTCR